MINRKKEFIDKLDAMDEREGIGEMVSDLAIGTVVNGLDMFLKKRKDQIPPAFIKAFNVVIDGLLDGEFERAEAKDGGETPPEPDPDDE